MTNSKQKTVSIVDYGSGNIRSLASAFLRAGADIKIVKEAKQIATADRLAIPGQGAFGQCAMSLKAIPHLWQAIDQRVRRDAIPFLGICVGMQLMAESGIEDGQHQGFGWIKGKIVKMQNQAGNLPLPHMGWNQIFHNENNSKTFFSKVKDANWFYFAHSYHFVTNNHENSALMCHYGQSFNAAIAHDNMIGTQFHPEKSQESGLRILEQFLTWQP
ncbi:MAG: imidazole glycerol phosphate synthase subunit HisH [Pseudomonadota bacterium]